MNKDKLTKISRQLSYILRHHPETIGLELDTNGWAITQDLLDAFGQHFEPLNMEDLRAVVAQNDKKRFAFNEDESKIRASQGHSIPIELGYQPQTPPQILYHGTATRYLDAIREKGLIKQNRHHVHLSALYATARQVGERHGVPVVLEVKAQEMVESGFEFFISENGVWLTDHVPSSFLIFPKA
jgi:putative RNA 2'-phosphotransferase